MKCSGVTAFQKCFSISNLWFLWKKAYFQYWLTSVRHTLRQFCYYFIGPLHNNYNNFDNNGWLSFIMRSFQGIVPCHQHILSFWNQLPSTQWRKKNSDWTLSRNVVFLAMSFGLRQYFFSPQLWSLHINLACMLFQQKSFEHVSVRLNRNCIS